ncbi:MAG: GAF domain-containing protein [Alcaligenes faecalis]
MRLAKHIPGAGPKKWWQKRWLREAVYNIPPIIAAIIVTLRSDGVEQKNIQLLGYCAVAWLVVAFILRVSAARDEDKKDEPDVVHEGLYAAVSTLHSILSHYCEQVGCGSELRATFHRVVPPLANPSMIEQIIPYVGWAESGVGREFSINTGITGHAIRSTKPTLMSSTSGSEQEQRRELVEGWGYTEAQASKLTSGRYSAVAIPVLDSTGQRTLGVLYLDSSDREMFDRDDVRQILGVGCDAISNFVTKRYV